MDIIRTLTNEIKKGIQREGLPVELVYLYGSYAKGKERKKSDIDIAILFNESEYAKDPLVALGKIQHIAIRIERLIKKEVDIRILNRSSLSFSYVVVTTGIPLYISSKRALYHYQNKILGMYFDFKPFLNRYISAYVGI